ncbi:restriction endonuclease [Streptomyces sp. VNUA24]|uniref:restriction endonuclease n=1 Tax=Streptomyces sp. VNUA24 TaxID=3031131 RepID=UPI0023B84E1B|nr:restriction endonuclease [Streptomyces sp. VNUA24]WEH13381.1 restriction endonuclease [Streptomyces sp. VNUA24]
MTTPARRTPPANRRRGFDLRSTALFFVFLALVVSMAGFAVHTVAGALERRPAWVFVLVVVAVAGVVASLRLRRRWHVASAARRAAAALDRAAREAAACLEAEVEARAEAEPDTLAVPRPRPAADPTIDVVDVVDGAEVAEVDYDALTPEGFEEAIAALCEHHGCSAVEVVGGAGDLGADVVAAAPDGSRVVIQCKQYGTSHRVGSQDLQRFGGTCFTVHEADVAVLVTTSDFTAPALEYAEQCGIVCVDGEALRAWTDGTGPRPWEAPLVEEATG